MAMALDTVRAARAADGVSRVIVVTDDPLVRAAVENEQCLCLPESGAVGLNSALRHGARWARLRVPGDGVAALAGDLPALKPAELAVALELARADAANVVPDREGAGTTLYAVGPAAPFQPGFGIDSFRRHLAAGAVAVPMAPERLGGLRRDVDTIEDLRAAAKLGLGPHTAALAESSGFSGWPPAESGCPTSAGG